MFLCNTDCRTIHAVCVTEVFIWKATWMFNLPCVCVCVYTSVCLCLLNWKFQTCSLNYSDFFLCLVAMAVWNGCSIHCKHTLHYTTHMHTHTHTQHSACWQMSTHKHTPKECGETDLMNLPPPSYPCAIVIKTLISQPSQGEGIPAVKTQWAGWEIKHVTGFLFMEHLQGSHLRWKPGRNLQNLK